MICTVVQYEHISMEDSYVFAYIKKDDLTRICYYLTESEAGEQN